MKPDSENGKPKTKKFPTFITIETMEDQSILTLWGILAPVLHDNAIPSSVTAMLLNLAANCEVGHFNLGFSLSYIVFVLITKQARIKLSPDITRLVSFNWDNVI